jgi:hypothetical protein
LEVFLTQPDTHLPIYEHTKRTDWGVALLAWERGEKRGFLFEDGVLRVIAEPYYHLMKPSEVDQASLSRAFQQQLSQMSLARAKGLVDSNQDASPFFTVEEQARLLVGQFPEGFSGPTWHEQHRGEGASKRLKRHRDPAIVQARKSLDSNQLARAVTERTHEDLWRDICGILRATDLVAPRELKALEQRLPRVDRNLTLALAALLHGENSEQASSEYGERFSAFVGSRQRQSMPTEAARIASGPKRGPITEPVKSQGTPPTTSIPGSISSSAIAGQLRKVTPEL